MNQNYDQVAELYAQGKLSWTTNSIIAILCTNAVFDPVDKTVADLSAEHRGVQPINNRLFVDGLAMGQPVAFQKVSAGVEFQVVVAQDVGNNNPNLLAFINSNADDSPITIANTGTLIIRPMLPPDPPSDASPTIGVWLRLPA